MTHLRARELLSFFLQQKLHPSDEDELFGWISTAPEAELRETIKYAWDNFTPADSIEQHKAEEMLSLILNYESQPLPIIKRSPLIRIVKYTVAASLLLVSG